MYSLTNLANAGSPNSSSFLASIGSSSYGSALSWPSAAPARGGAVAFAGRGGGKFPALGNGGGGGGGPPLGGGGGGGPIISAFYLGAAPPAYGGGGGGFGLAAAANNGFSVGAIF